MRRYCQFRLRTALVLMALVALPCSWLSATLQQWRIEQQVLAAIGPAALENASQPLLMCFL
jgi:hypothetical protein